MAGIAQERGRERRGSFHLQNPQCLHPWHGRGGEEKGAMACHFTLSLPGLSPCHSALAMNLKRVWP